MQSQQQLQITINFEEASKEWNANKKKTITGYKYVCSSTIGKTKKRCTTVCSKQTEFCYIHRKRDNAKLILF